MNKLLLSFIFITFCIAPYDYNFRNYNIRLRNNRNYGPVNFQPLVSGRKFNSICQRIDSQTFTLPNSETLTWDVARAFLSEKIILGKGGFGVVKQVCFPFSQINKSTWNHVIPKSGKVVIKKCKITKTDFIELEMLKKMSDDGKGPIFYGCQYNDRTDSIYIVQEKLAFNLYNPNVYRNFIELSIERRLWFYKKMFHQIIDIAERNYSHNDIKPENTMFNDDFSDVFFIDFGLAGKIGEKTVCGGTEYFLSPSKCQIKRYLATIYDDFYTLLIMISLLETRKGGNVFQKLGDQGAYIGCKWNKDDECIELLRKNIIQLLITEKILLDPEIYPRSSYVRNFYGLISDTLSYQVKNKSLAQLAMIIDEYFDNRLSTWDETANPIAGVPKNTNDYCPADYVQPPPEEIISVPVIIKPKPIKIDNQIAQQNLQHEEPNNGIFGNIIGAIRNWNMFGDVEPQVKTQRPIKNVKFQQNLVEKKSLLKIAQSSSGQLQQVIRPDFSRVNKFKFPQLDQPKQKNIIDEDDIHFSKNSEEDSNGEFIETVFDDLENKISEDEHAIEMPKNLIAKNKENILPKKTEDPFKRVNILKKQEMIKPKQEEMTLHSILEYIKKNKPKQFINI